MQTETPEKIFLVYGPSGSGLGFYSERIREFLGCTTAFDELFPFSMSDVQYPILVLSNEARTEQFISFHTNRDISPIDIEALKQIMGINDAN